MVILLNCMFEIKYESIEFDVHVHVVMVMGWNKILLNGAVALLYKHLVSPRMMEKLVELGEG